MNRKIFGTAILAVFVAAAWGCSDDDDHDHSSSSSGGHTSEFPSCQAIITACHPLDNGPGPAHDCHEVGHDNPTEEKCAAKKAECLATCTAPGTSDAGDGG
ncbi:MAG: hypothetical protein KIT84_11485 [Labilithrix sp.]|nr:hypothetical protein [Labilithrix sp.]MCW5811632.1 hypothetical protein [Labilithrix sp.]